MKYINRIHGIIPGTTNTIDLPVLGRSLIITGANGSGKTFFLRAILKEINGIVETRGENSFLGTLKKIETQREVLKAINNEYRTTEEQFLKYLEEGLPNYQLTLNIDIPNTDKLHSIKSKGLIRIFEADRMARIESTNSARGLEEDKTNYISQGQESQIGSNLGQHLVSLYNRRSHAITEDQNYVLADKIKLWFDSFESNLKELMEDQTTHLKFNPDHLSFTIKRADKPDTNFQTLSSGYSSIFAIYSELLMRVEAYQTTPDDIEGIILIDEIESHLHISLQRQILPFFERSFPKIQFIITTHSPFVLASVNDAIIYDISSNESISEDVSLYSYSTIIEALLGTKSTSIILDKIIHQIHRQTSSPDVNYKKLRALINKVRPSEYYLDPISKSYYLKGINILQDKDQENVSNDTTE